MCPIVNGRRAAEYGGSGFGAHGVPFVAVGVQVAGPLDVLGRRSVGDPGLWGSVEVSVSNEAVVATRRVGDVGVDWARLILGDLDALGHWVHDGVLDGRADVAFWGRDADEAAECFEPMRLDHEDAGIFGWEDLPLAEAEEHYRRVEAWRAEGGRGLVADCRPHSHHYYVMRQVLGSETESGVLTVGGDVLVS